MSKQKPLSHSIETGAFVMYTVGTSPGNRALLAYELGDFFMLSAGGQGRQRDYTVDERNI
jgi:hypothetical protein